MIGKKLRLKRILNMENGKTLIVPMDHGASVGPIEGLTEFRTPIEKVVKGGANVIVGHTGLGLHGFKDLKEEAGFILHLSASTNLSPDPNEKVLINTVENAVKMGADGVSVHVNIGSTTEAKMIENLGKISVECMKWGMPLLVMIYPRGKNIINPKDKEAVKIAVRVAGELGADIVKTKYTGDIDSFREVIRGSLVPVVIAGGSKGSEKEILQMIKDSIDAGGSGVAMGRNSFQHKTPEKFIKAVSLIIHKNKNVDDAIKEAGL
jgi:fructose-bisphosphate aldolase / 2-amino-3,7-dideoxy-D-threo-hept-6-ulosonate synthase